MTSGPQSGPLQKCTMQEELLSENLKCSFQKSFIFSVTFSSQKHTHRFSLPSPRQQVATHWALKFCSVLSLCQVMLCKTSPVLLSPRWKIYDIMSAEQHDKCQLTKTNKKNARHPLCPLVCRLTICCLIRSQSLKMCNPRLHSRRSRSASRLNVSHLLLLQHQRD